MDSANFIKIFLERVSRQHTRRHLLQGGWLILGLLAGSALAAAGIAYYTPHIYAFRIPLLLLWLLVLAYVVGRYWVLPLCKRLTPLQAALRVERQVTGLNNNLINAVQLESYLEKATGKNEVSREFIEEHLRRTANQLKKIDPHHIVPEGDFTWPRNLALGLVTVALVMAFVKPDLWTRGYDRLTKAPAPHKSPTLLAGSAESTSPAPPEIEYEVENLRLTFNYPAYTRLKQVVIDPSDGKVQVLPGTEVRIRARLNHEVSGAALVVNNRDNYNMNYDGTTLEGSLLAKEPGHYQIQVKTPQGSPVLLAKKYPIALGKDKAPTITLLLANPKPVYNLTDKVRFFYEANDDFGIQSIDLVIDVEGQILRKPVKNLKGAVTDAKDGYTWELSTMRFQPGDRVQYYLEVSDNDNIFGPNTGQSEAFSFEIFDERTKRLDLIALQDELVNQMVELLARSLVEKRKKYGNTVEEMEHRKRVLASATNQLIDIIRIAQSIHAQATTIRSFPRPYLTLLDNIITGLNEIREAHIQTLDQLSNAIVKATPIGFHFPPVDDVQDRLISHLERDILFLFKIINRERMDEVMNMERDLADLTDALREQFDKARDQKTPLKKPQFKAMLKKIKETLQKIMEQLARQTQALPDEFLNRNAFENLNMENFSASLEKLMDLVNQGKMDEAMEELEKLTDDLRAFADQLEDMRSNQENLVDLEIMKKLDDSRRKLEQLEKKQKSLLDKTTDINKSLRQKQSEKFENKLTDFFQSLKKDVNAIQAILEKDSRFLLEHPKMKQLNEMLDREAELSRELQELSQKTLDSMGRRSERQNFKALHDARDKLADLVGEIQMLRFKMVKGFSDFLPKLGEKYGKLEEFADMMNLYDFNAQFQKTYPEILRWQNHFRTARTIDSDIQEQMNKDLFEVNRLNSEISKKLGSLMRELEQDYQSLISDEERQQLQELAEQQSALKNQADEMAENFQKMNQQNPMISPQLSNKMDATGRFMKRSGRSLKNQRLPDSIEAENRALNELAETREMLEDLKNANQGQGQGQQRRSMRLGQGLARDDRRGGGSSRMQQERVNLPSEDQYKVPGQFRDEILKAMKNPYPKQYERLIGEYYKELVK